MKLAKYIPRILKANVLLVLLALTPSVFAASPPPLQTVQGVVYGFEPTRRTLLIGVNTGPLARSMIDVWVVSSSRIIRDGFPADFQNVRVGDTVQCTLRIKDGRFTVQELNAATTLGRRISASTLINIHMGNKQSWPHMVFEKTMGTLRSRALAFFDEQTLFRKEGSGCAPQDLRPGDMVSLIVVPQADGSLLATTVDASVPPAAKPYSVAGVIAAVRESTLTVRAGNGVEVDILIHPDAYIRRDKERVQPEDAEAKLKRGDQIIASGDVNEDLVLVAVVISAASPDYAFDGATVLKLIFEESTFLIKTSDGAVLKVLTAPGTSIQRWGYPADFMDVPVGSTVDVRAVSIPDGRLLLTSLDVVE
ncbi:MAG: hypothetical protein ACP5R4_08315 [Armatimonadota bacterium]